MKGDFTVLKWSDADLFIYEFIKCLFGSGDTDYLYGLLSRCDWGQIAHRPLSWKYALFFMIRRSPGKRRWNCRPRYEEMEA
jgi:hypothetical protein